MSYDFATAQICPHEVRIEAVTQDPGFQNTIQFPKPPSNSKVSVYIDGLLVPQSGLFAPASLPFGKSGPYRIKSGINDLLYVRVGFGMPQLITLLPGLNVKASDLAADLQFKLPNLKIYVANNRVVFEAQNAALGTAFSFQDPRWTDKTSSLPSTARVLSTYSNLGVVPGRCVTGKKIYPGWIIEPPADPIDSLQRQIRFESPLLNHDPLIQICYFTVAGFCRRCFGSQIEFDYSVLNGTFEIVDDFDLLSQEFDKFIFTKIGTHFKWAWLGSNILNRIGGKGASGSVSINANINMDVAQAFKIYQNIKAQQSLRFPSQKVSDAEFPFSLGGLKVVTSPDDPTVAVLDTEVISRSRVSVSLKRIIGNPNPFFLSGSSNPFLPRG